MPDSKFKKIDDLNKTLEDIYTLADKYLTNLDLDGLIQKKAQEKVDDACIRISNKINSKLIDKRGDLIDFLHGKYVTSQKIISEFGPVAQAIENLGIPTSIDDVVSILSDTVKSLKNFAKLFLGPYQEAVEYVVELAPKLVELTENIEKLASLPSKIPAIPNVPNVNFDKLKITMPPITMEEVITGNKVSGDSDIA